MSSNLDHSSETKQAYIPFPVICAILIVYVSSLMICFVRSRPILEIPHPHEAREKKIRRDRIADGVAKVYVQKK